MVNYQRTSDEKERKQFSERHNQLSELRLPQGLGCAVLIAAVVAGLGYMTYLAVQEKRERNRQLKSEYDACKGQIEGTVTSEEYNEENQYFLKVHADDGRDIALSVVAKDNSDIKTLDMLIDVGTRVSFPKGNVYKVGGLLQPFGRSDETSFLNDKVNRGMKHAHNIQVLNKRGVQYTKRQYGGK
ncbi:hypothetical protein KY359_03555 [Candidatus Woesearchaeota archaeon]|nr:hypothetical protein [Candidatus Woesearchaeota archaeon]